MTTLMHNDWKITFPAANNGRISLEHESHPGHIHIEINDSETKIWDFAVKVWDQGLEAIRAACFGCFDDLQVDEDPEFVDFTESSTSDEILTTLEHGGWVVELSADEPRYVWVSRKNYPGHIQIKADDEGFVVDVWNEDNTQAVATCAALYNELAAEGEDDEG